VTAETKYVIAVEDIQAFILVCECKVQLILPANDLARVPHVCPACKEEWKHPNTSTQADTFMADVDAVKKDKRRFTLKLEVSGPSK
jgi:hypothetical protein